MKSAKTGDFVATVLSENSTIAARTIISTSPSPDEPVERVERLEHFEL
jgi:hypothetical protein